ncbi:MAG: hypothetical protein IJQ39_10440 [Thermoguttaceae bacterium]|nr:hypothetical protein [Thermoguttaceae bacterium]
MENAIRFAKKYYFWPVCLIALGLALFFWSTSIGELDNEFTSNESNYNKSKSSVDGIPQNPPNDKMLKTVERKKNNLVHNVYDAWELLYKKQNENNKWPEIFINGQLVDFNVDRITVDGATEQYRYRIVEEFKNLVDTLHLVSERDKNGISMNDEIHAAAMDSATAELANAVAKKDDKTSANVKKELVVWSENDIDKLIEDRLSLPPNPTKLQIDIVQENFWIFQNLIDAIKTLNEGVDNRNNASLKEVRSLLIVNDAVEKFQTRQENGFFDEKNFSKTSNSEDEGVTEGEGGSSGVSSGGEGGESLKREYRELFDMRYVDKNGRGLSAEQFNAINNVEVAGINASKTRNVPIYMSLVIKQNRLSDLMSALANAEKPVEIKLVLINPGQEWLKPKFDFSLFEEDNGENPEGMASDSPRGGRGSAGKSGRRSSSRNSDRSRSNDHAKINSDEVVVDIYGIINLFNVPSKKLFPSLEQNDENAIDESDENNADNAEESDDAAAKNEDE